MLIVKRMLWRGQDGDAALLLPAASFLCGVLTACFLPFEGYEADILRPPAEAFAYGALPIAAIALLGAFAPGTVGIPAAFALRGYLLGRTVCALCSANGAAAALALLGPAELVLIPLTVWVGTAAFSRSFAALRRVKPTLRLMPPHIYFLRAAVCTIAGGFAAVYGDRLGREIFYALI